MSEHNVSFNMVFKNTEATDPLREYVDEKLTHAMQKYIHQDTSVHIKLEVEKHRQIAEATFNCFGTNFNATEESENMYKSIDALVENVSKQLRRHKDKITNHH